MLAKPLPVIVVRAYSPAHDYPEIKKNLIAAGRYVSGQTDKKQVDDFTQRMPTSLLVAHYEDSATIEGNIFVPDSIVPFVCFFALRPGCERPEEVSKALYNAAFDVLRERGAPFVEELFDIGQYNPEIWKQRGFEDVWKFTGTVRPLWNNDGTPYPNLKRIG